jgi:pimeloyl-ACP methyl ester carboxylesterase
MTTGAPRVTAGRRLKRLARLLATGYLLWCLTLTAVQSHLLYMPPARAMAMSAKEIASDSSIEQCKGATESWLMRAAAQPSRGLVCFLHGNAELIDHCTHEAQEWNNRGFDVVLPEYRGYGRASGSPSQDGIVADVIDAISRAMAITGDTRLILHGRSLGTGVSAQVAALGSIRPAGIVLESPFTSVASFAWRYGIPPLLVTNPYRTDEVISSFECPILILQGRDDEIVPVAHGERLASLNTRAKLVKLEGSHNSGLSLEPEYWEAVDALISRVDFSHQGSER